EPRWGSIEIEPDNPEVGQDLAKRLRTSAPAIHMYRWNPPAHLQAELPADFEFRLRCLDTPGGRRFYPALGTAYHLKSGFAGGLAVLSALGRLTAEQRSSYRVGWLMFERLRKTREHLDNRLLWGQSLTVRRSARGREARSTILVEGIGLPDGSDGKPLKLEEVLQLGQEALGQEVLAQQAEGLEPARTEQRLIRLGLLAAARQAPLQLDPDD